VSLGKKEVSRICDQLERAHRGGAWHGPSLREVLADVDSNTASARPIANGHSIRELVIHVMVWEIEAAARLVGKGCDDLPLAEAWPEHRTEWNELLLELDAAHEGLMSAIGALDDEALDNPVNGNPGTTYHLLHGVIQHNLYHAGQIVMLKKAL
jgi:uncharacterized damage-inducible protein DinB